MGAPREEMAAEPAVALVLLGVGLVDAVASEFCHDGVGDAEVGSRPEVDDTAGAVIRGKHDNDLESSIVAIGVAPSAIDGDGGVVEMAHSLGFGTEVAVEVKAGHTPELGVPLGEVDVAPDGAKEAVGLGDAPIGVGVEPAHIATLRFERKPIGKGQEKLQVQAIAIQAEKTRRSLGVEAAQAQLLAEGEIVHLETIAVVPVLVHQGDIDLPGELPVVPHGPPETGSEVDEEVVLAVVVNVAEIETEAGKKVQTRGWRLGADMERPEGGKHGDKQSHGAEAAAEDVALSHSIK